MLLAFFPATAGGGGGSSDCTSFQDAGKPIGTTHWWSHVVCSAVGREEGSAMGVASLTGLDYG